MRRYRFNLNKLGAEKVDRLLPPINCLKAPLHNIANRRTPDKRDINNDYFPITEKEIVPNKSQIERQRKRVLELNKIFKILSRVPLFLNIDRIMKS